MDKMNTSEIEGYGIELVDRITNAKFTQGFRGYGTAEVDDFLDSLIQQIKVNSTPDIINQMIKTADIANMTFKKGFRGYEANGVDVFLKKISKDIEKLNEIKSKYIK